MITCDYGGNRMAQSLAKKRWKLKNKSKQSYYRYHSDARTFIKKCKSKNELDGLLHLIKLKEDNVNSHKPNNKKRLSIKHFINRIIKGDTISVMDKIPSNSIDMVLVDLPYGTTQNKWDSVISLSKLWKEYKRIVKPRGAMVFTAQGPFAAKLMLSNLKDYKYDWIWVKSKATNFLNVHRQPLRKHEDILVFYRKQPVYHPQMTKGNAYSKGVRKNQLTGSYGDFKPTLVKSKGGRYPVDVLYFKTAESEGKVVHPTQKPISLARYLVRTYTNLGDLVLDNTCGSGSFPVGALLEGRNFIGIDNDSSDRLFKNKKPINYVLYARRRIRKTYIKMENSLFERRKLLHLKKFGLLK